MAYAIINCPQFSLKYPEVCKPLRWLPKSSLLVSNSQIFFQKQTVLPVELPFSSYPYLTGLLWARKTQDPLPKLRHGLLAACNLPSSSPSQECSPPEALRSITRIKEINSRESPTGFESWLPLSTYLTSKSFHGMASQLPLCPCLGPLCSCHTGL